jgi:hypothetical protein
MIPYEELVAALAPEIASPPVAEHGHDVVDLDDELIDHVEEVGPRDYAYGRPEYQDRSVQAYREAHADEAVELEHDELMDHDSLPLQEEATRPAGLAGLANPMGDAAPVEPDPAAGQERPVARGRSRNRRRRK